MINQLVLISRFFNWREENKGKNDGIASKDEVEEEKEEEEEEEEEEDADNQQHVTLRFF